jgi:hypothetical protein
MSYLVVCLEKNFLDENMKFMKRLRLNTGVDPLQRCLPPSAGTPCHATTHDSLLPSEQQAQSSVLCKSCELAKPARARANDYPSQIREDSRSFRDHLISLFGEKHISDLKELV